MNAKTQLALLRTLSKQRKGLAKGFTLVELMIVVAVIGILSAVALPQYLQARNAAAAGSAVGEAIGIAKECATFIASGGVGSNPTSPTNGPSVTCTTPTNGGSIQSRSWTAGPAGIACLNVSELATTVSNVSILVTSQGQLSCS